MPEIGPYDYQANHWTKDAKERPAGIPQSAEPAFDKFRESVVNPDIIADPKNLKIVAEQFLTYSKGAIEAADKGGYERRKDEPNAEGEEKSGPKNSRLVWTVLGSLGVGAIAGITVWLIMRSKMHHLEAQIQQLQQAAQGGGQ